MKSLAGKTSFRVAVAMLLATVFIVPAAAMPRPTIIEYLENDGRFTTLLAALDAADLTDVLDGKKSYTLNAPTDAAFEKLPEGTVAGLLADKEALTSVLLYHVVKGNKKAKKLLKNTTTATLNGSNIFTYFEGENAYHNRAMISSPDNRVKNGIVHEMDDVILPPEEPITGKNLVDLLRLDGRFGTLLAAVDAAGLTETLATGKKLVLCAPTDEAFAKLPAGTVEALLNDIPALTDILTYHVIPTKRGKVMQLSKKDGEVESLNGAILTFRMVRDSYVVNDSNIIRSDIRGNRNTWLQTIDTVLLPPSDN